MDKQIMFKLNEDDLKIIQDAAKLSGLGFTTFCRMSSLEKAREVLVKNNSSQ